MPQVAALLIAPPAERQTGAGGGSGPSSVRRHAVLAERARNSECPRPGGAAGTHVAMLKGTLPDKNLLSAMLGPDFSISVARPSAGLDGLFAEERAYIANAVQKRQAEFATARRCAREALVSLGVAPYPLVPKADRSPAWPRGVTGSITHTEDCCIAALARTPPTLSVGIDVEPDAPLSAELEPLICVAAERRWLDRATPTQRTWLLRLIFSAKEAFYKCHYGAHAVWLDFTDVHLSLDLDQGVFQAAAAHPHAVVQDAHLILGQYRRTNGFIVTSAVLRRASNGAADG